MHGTPQDQQFKREHTEWEQPELPFPTDQEDDQEEAAA